MQQRRGDGGGRAKGAARARKAFLNGVGEIRREPGAFARQGKQRARLAGLRRQIGVAAKKPRAERIERSLRLTQPAGKIVCAGKSRVVKRPRRRGDQAFNVIGEIGVCETGMGDFLDHRMGAGTLAVAQFLQRLAPPLQPNFAQRRLAYGAWNAAQFAMESVKRHQAARFFYVRILRGEPAVLVAGAHKIGAIAL